jgi:hypothetical protein
MTALMTSRKKGGASAKTEVAYAPMPPRRHKYVTKERFSNKKSFKDLLLVKTFGRI